MRTPRQERFLREIALDSILVSKYSPEAFEENSKLAMNMLESCVTFLELVRIRK
jgi:hypothetical protein